MEKAGKSIITVSLAFLLLSIMLSGSLMTKTVAAVDAEDSNVNLERTEDGKWWKIKTDMITILFPADGKKPMFLWWYTNDTDNVYVVKYKGLIEYLTLDYPYYVRKYEADALTIRERLEAKYASMGPHRTRIRNLIQTAFFSWLLDLHPAYLPFSACKWTLEGPENVTREDGVSYIGFNFTLTEAPSRFDFAEGNVIIRCRFYGTDAIESAHGQYMYEVNAGELKMDLVIRNWEWNMDKLDRFFDILNEEFNVTAPKMRSGLALWTDLASIEIEDMPIAEQDAFSTDDLVEGHSRASAMLIGNNKIKIRENLTATGADETPMTLQDRIRERYRLRFANESQTLAGFFDFVDRAVIINSTTDEMNKVNVTAAYISAGNHMRLFIGYPYFGADTLEHDPSIGVEGTAIAAFTKSFPLSTLTFLIAATAVIAGVIVAFRLLKKPVNIINVK